MHKLAFTVIVVAAGLINGCGGGQTSPDDATKQQQRCGPQTRCGPVDDDRPPANNIQPSNTMPPAKSKGVVIED